MSCLCGGSGRIYDFNPKSGDPCPECTGGSFSARGQVGYTVAKVKMHPKSGCVVVALLLLGGASGVAWAVAELIA